MDREVYSDNSVRWEAESRFICLKLDADKGEGKTLAKKFGVASFPSFVFVNKDGDFLYKASGAFNKKSFIDLVKIAKTKGAPELAKRIKEYKEGKIPHKDLPAYMDYIRKSELSTVDVLEKYLSKLSDKEKLSPEIFYLILRNSNRSLVDPVRYILKNRKVYKKIIDGDVVDNYLFNTYIWACYEYKRAGKSVTPLFEELNKFEYPWAYAVKENYEIVYDCRKKENWKKVVERSKKVIKSCPITYSHIMNELAKQVWCWPEVENDFVMLCNMNKKGAPRAYRSAAFLFEINANDPESAYRLYMKGKALSGSDDYCKIQIDRCGKQIGAIRHEKYGQSAFNFELKDLEGNIVKLSDLRGKYILLDWWASWCGPCIGEIPYLKHVHKYVKNRKDWIVVSISIDSNEKSWRSAVENHGMTWMQLNCKDKKIKNEYQIKGIPRIMLLDKNGKFINDNMRGKSIISMVNRVLSKN